MVYYDRDGCWVFLFAIMCGWSPEHDVFFSLDGSPNLYVQPEAYRGDKCCFSQSTEWNFRDVTDNSDIFDS